MVAVVFIMLWRKGSFCVLSNYVQETRGRAEEVHMALGGRA